MYMGDGPVIIVRTLQIGWAAAGLLAAGAADRFSRPEARPGSAFPARLRRTLERLGPTFVKLGQALSQRKALSIVESSQFHARRPVCMSRK